MPTQSSDKQRDSTNAEMLQKALYQLLEQISKRDQKILSITADKTALSQELMEKEKIIAEENASLLFTEHLLDQVLDSRAWKIASKIQDIRTFLVPPESRRAQFLEKALNLVSPSSKKTIKN